MTTTKHPRMAAALTTAMLVLGTSACSSENAATASAQDAPAASTAPEENSRTVADREPDWPRITLRADRERFEACMSSAKQPTGAGNAEFGRKAVKRAYCDMAEFTEFYAFTDLMRKRQDDVAAFEGPTDYMTQKAAKEWRRTARRAVAGNHKAMSHIQSLVFFDNGNKRLVFQDDAPVVLSRRHTGATAAVEEVDGEARLSLRVTVIGLVNRFDRRTGKPRLDRVKRLTGYFLVPNDDPSTPWLIDEYGAAQSEVERVR